MKRIVGCILLSLAISGSLAVCVLFMAAAEKAKEGVHRSVDDHVQVNLALLSYHDAHGRLPPAVIRGADGEPLYSWRVVILPFLDNATLHREFHLDEPWDSPHNITLLDKMPMSYTAPRKQYPRVQDGHTTIHVFVGKGTAFDGDEGLNLQNDFPDGLADTILVVDTGKPAPWTKPEDLPYSPDEPLPDLAGHFHDGFWAMTATNRRRWVSKGTSEATLRTLITRNAGDQPGVDWRD